MQSTIDINNRHQQSTSTIIYDRHTTFDMQSTIDNRDQQPASAIDIHNVGGSARNCRYASDNRHPQSATSTLSCVSALCTPCVMVASCWVGLDCTGGYASFACFRPAHAKKLPRAALAIRTYMLYINLYIYIYIYICMICEGGRGRRRRGRRCTDCTDSTNSANSMDCTRLLSHRHSAVYGDCSLPRRGSPQDCLLQLSCSSLLKLPHFLQYQSFPTKKSMSRGHLHVFLLQNPRNRQL